MSYTQKVISLYDLMNYKESKEIVLSGDKKALKEALFTLGLNVKNEPYYEEECYHRPATKADKAPWYGIRYVCSERVDDEWINSGYASMEAIIESSDDLSLKAVLNGMNRQSAVDKTWNNKEAAKVAIKNESKV